MKKQTLIQSMLRYNGYDLQKQYNITNTSNALRQAQLPFGEHSPKSTSQKNKSFDKYALTPAQIRKYKNKGYEIKTIYKIIAHNHLR